MKVDVKLNMENILKIGIKAEETLVDTADALKTDLLKSQIMPFDTGILQNDFTYISKKSKNAKRVLIISDTPYARKLYFHPEYKFDKTKNSNAGGLWFNQYIEGEKKELPKRLFMKILKGKLS